MRKLQSIAMFLLTLCLSFSVASCSSDDDNKSKGISKEDIIGFWEIDTDQSQILSAKVNGEDISVEKLKEDYGDYSPKGLLFLNEDGTSVFNETESLWKVEENGFNLYKSGAEGTSFKVSDLSYDKITVEYQTTIKDQDNVIITTCSANLKRYSLESSSNDNNLIVGSWKAVYEGSIGDFKYTINYYYDFYANGSFKLRMEMTGSPDFVQFGVYTFNKSEKMLKTNLTEIPAVLDGNSFTVTTDDGELEYKKQ